MSQEPPSPPSKSSIASRTRPASSEVGQEVEGVKFESQPLVRIRNKSSLNNRNSSGRKSSSTFASFVKWSANLYIANKGAIRYDLLGMSRYIRIWTIRNNFFLILSLLWSDTTKRVHHFFIIYPDSG